MGCKGLWESREAALIQLLHEHGPMKQKNVMEKLGWTYRVFLKVLRANFEKIKVVKFCRGTKRGGAKYGIHQLWGELAGWNWVVFLVEDERIIEYVGSRIAKPRSSGMAGAMKKWLNEYFGSTWARQMIERAGYKYKK